MSETWSETGDANTCLVGSGPVWSGSVRVRLVEFGLNPARQCPVRQYPVLHCPLLPNRSNCNVQSCYFSASIFRARQHYALRAICYRPTVSQSVCLSVCPPSHGWISQKWVKLGSCNFLLRVAQSLQKFQRVPPERGHQTRVEWGKQAIFYIYALVSPKR